LAETILKRLPSERRLCLSNCRRDESDSQNHGQHIISQMSQTLRAGVDVLLAGSTARHYDAFSALSNRGRIFNVRIQMMAHQFSLLPMVFEGILPFDECTEELTVPIAATS
jgi:hypothetical protein